MGSEVNHHSVFFCFERAEVHAEPKLLSYIPSPEKALLRWLHLLQPRCDKGHVSQTPRSHFHAPPAAKTSRFKMLCLSWARLGNGSRSEGGRPPTRRPAPPAHRRRPPARRRGGDQTWAEPRAGPAGGRPRHPPPAPQYAGEEAPPRERWLGPDRPESFRRSQAWPPARFPRAAAEPPGPPPAAPRRSPAGPPPAPSPVTSPARWRVARAARRRRRPPEAAGGSVGPALKRVRAAGAGQRRSSSPFLPACPPFFPSLPSLQRRYRWGGSERPAGGRRPPRCRPACFCWGCSCPLPPSPPPAPPPAGDASWRLRTLAVAGGEDGEAPAPLRRRRRRLWQVTAPARAAGGAGGASRRRGGAGGRTDGRTPAFLPGPCPARRAPRCSGAPLSRLSRPRGRPRCGSAEGAGPVRRGSGCGGGTAVLPRWGPAGRAAPPREGARRRMRAGSCWIAILLRPGAAASASAPAVPPVRAGVSGAASRLPRPGPGPPPPRRPLPRPRGGRLPGEDAGRPPGGPGGLQRAPGQEGRWPAPAESRVLPCRGTAGCIAAQEPGRGCEDKDVPPELSAGGGGGRGEGVGGVF